MQIYSNKVFKNPKYTIKAFSGEDFSDAFLKLEELKNDYFLVGYIRYEAKNVFLGQKYFSKLPLIYFEAYENFEEFEPDKFSNDVYLNPKISLEFEKYKEKIEKIKDEISNGNTYEVNFTLDFDIDTKYLPNEIFNSLLKVQKTPYCALLSNAFEDIISFSPELFFKLEGNKIVTKPMKGTICRGKSEIEDIKNKEFLKNDPKNRAENVMIVDLLRNDLGKISKTGTVCASKLFEIEEHKTLFQMTSTVTSELLDNVSIFDIFKAIFPSGSITGAPKISTMEIIDELEAGKRGVYCGAIGIINKKFMEFSVPIRILQKSKNENTFKYRAGGAIVWNSNAKDEYDEVKLKAKFLSSNIKPFKILETILVSKNCPEYFLEHINRMKNSAKYFDFKFNEEILNLKFQDDGIYKVLLSKNGEFEILKRELLPNSTNKIKIADTKVSNKNIFLYHKTTNRAHFDKTMEKIKKGEVFDEIYFNENGEITEGARSNIVLEINGKYYTPPVSSGLLAGVLRQKLLFENKIEEKVLKIEDLTSANKIFCINSVRKIVEVKL